MQSIGDYHTSIDKSERDLFFAALGAQNRSVRPHMNSVMQGVGTTNNTLFNSRGDRFQANASSILQRSAYNEDHSGPTDWAQMINQERINKLT